MDRAAQLAVFQAQVANVRALESSMRQMQQRINAALRANDEPTTSSLTKLQALMFCAWAEANFSKVLHTPHGFELDEIRQVQAAKTEGIAAAWKKCVELGLRHVDARRGSFTPNAKRKIDEVIVSHVFDQSLLRNKLAHGQWVVALNRSNNAVQQDLTTQIAEIDIVKISGWKNGHVLLANLVESLIESPKKFITKDWYQFVVAIEVHIVEYQKRSLAEHVRRLKSKDHRTSAKSKGRGAVEA